MWTYSKGSSMCFSLQCDKFWDDKLEGHFVVSETVPESVQISKNDKQETNSTYYKVAVPYKD